MRSGLFRCYAFSAMWTVCEWIFSLAFALCTNRASTRDVDFVKMQSLTHGNSKNEADGRDNNGLSCHCRCQFRDKIGDKFVESTVEGDSSRCARNDSEKSREKIRERIRHRIYAKTVIFPVISRDSAKEIGILRKSTQDMSRIPLIATDCEKSFVEPNPCNMVMLEAGLPGDTWRYCVERERLAERSEWFRAMLVGPLAPAPSDPPPLVKLEYVEKRAFDYLFRYLHDEPINFQSVSTARATLDAAHQYLCPELVRLAVDYLERNLNSSTVLETYQGLGLYANHGTSGPARSSNSPSAPPPPGDDAGEIAAACTKLYLACLDVIDLDPAAVFSQERFEELSTQEVLELARRDTLRLINESTLFYALDRWAASECRRHGVDPSGSNKRAALSDEVWYSVRYPIMTDREFIEGPMASGILNSEESAFIAKILGQPQSREAGEFRSSVTGPLSRLSSIPRIGVRTYEDQDCRMLKPGKKEQQDNRKNRRKECASQGQRTCARIGNCLVRVLACVFD